MLRGCSVLDIVVHCTVHSIAYWYARLLQLPAIGTKPAAPAYQLLAATLSAASRLLAGWLCAGWLGAGWLAGWVLAGWLAGWRRRAQLGKLLLGR